MNAGRELDVLIAEKVMGIVPFAAHICIECGSPKGLHMVVGRRDHTPDGQWRQTTGCSFQEANRYRYDAIKYYSASIADAYLVVEKLRSMDWLVIIQHMPSPDKPVWEGRAVCELKFTGKGWRNNAWASANTTPHAICLAALNAMNERRVMTDGDESEV